MFNAIIFFLSAQCVTDTYWVFYMYEYFFSVSLPFEVDSISIDI